MLQYFNVFTQCTICHAKQIYLSPIYLHTSLGRSAGTNPFVEYRSLTGQMGYCKNRRTFSHYSSIIGAFLQTADLSVPNNRWYHPSCVMLVIGLALQQNNSYLSAYHFISSHIISKHLLTSGHRQSMNRIVIMNLLLLYFHQI